MCYHIYVGGTLESLLFPRRAEAAAAAPTDRIRLAKNGACEFSNPMLT